MSFPIALIAGAALAVVASVAGVSAYQGSPAGVDDAKLYSYAEK